MYTPLFFAWISFTFSSSDGKAICSYCSIISDKNSASVDVASFSVICSPFKFNCSHRKNENSGIESVTTLYHGTGWGGGGVLGPGTQKLREWGLQAADGKREGRRWDSEGGGNKEKL